MHVEDICRAYIAVLKSPIPKVHGRAFNVGRTTENYQIRDLAAIVANTIPGCRIETAPGVSPDARCYRVSCDALPTAV